MIQINNNTLDLNQLNKYINFNSKDILNVFPEDVKPFINLTVTSPPYWDAKQYGEVDQTGYKQKYEDYLEDIHRTFSGVYKLSKDSSTLYVISDTLKRNGRVIRIPDDIAKILETIGWIHQDVIIWNKGKTLPWSRKGQLRNKFEYINVFTKTNNFVYNIDQIRVPELTEWWIDYPERYSPLGKVPDNIWKFFIPTQGSWGIKKDFGDKEFRHACPFPPEMMARMILLSSNENDVVFDPYAGTGVLLATAASMKRKFLGFDTNSEYKSLFEQVTSPWIQTDIMPKIKLFYKNQQDLRDILKETIYKLRILKYQKELIKYINKAFEKSKKENDYFIASFAIEEILESEKSNGKKIGKASYYLIWNNPENIQLVINKAEGLIKKPPFSKYGLITNVIILSSLYKLDEIPLNCENQYSLYSKGVINNQYNSITVKDIPQLISDKRNEYSYKGIPPIISNISVHKEDYKGIPSPGNNEMFDFDQFENDGD